MLRLLFDLHLADIAPFSINLLSVGAVAVCSYPYIVGLLLGKSADGQFCAVDGLGCCFLHVFS